MRKKRKIVFLFFFCIFLCCFCHDNNTPAYENISQTSGSSFTPAITTDNSGNVYVVWADSTPGNFEIFFSEKSGNGAWTQSMNISNNSFGSHAPFIDIDDFGNLHICWWDIGLDTPLTRITYRERKADGTWNSTEVLGQVLVDDSSYNLPRICCDANNSVFVAWEGGLGLNLRYRYKSTIGPWSDIMVIPDGGATNSPQMAADINGNLHIVWEGGSYILYQRRTATGVWQDLATITNANLPIAADIRVDGSDIVWITWSAANYVYCSNNKSGTWSTPEKLPMKKNDDTGCLSTFDSESNGTLHFIWEDWTKDSTGNYGEADIYYAKKYPEGNWSEIHNISNTAARSICGNSHISVDNLGNAHIVWADEEPGNFDILYLKIPKDSF